MPSNTARALLALALGTLPMLAMAQEASENPNGIDKVDFTREMTTLPELPSRFHCEQLVADSGADNEAFNRCMRMEETAYNELQDSFMNYPDQARTLCGNSILGMDMGYMGLRHCLERTD
ncbi:hypothetical protein [Halomonas sp. I5-271120]|uniref:hypothetical protein n=1 Tax=Halomonas sp. I5-271120 TaxID=3061632 RepID=UPI002714CC0A|nr:hypothetical protein [Halomonas sp. I5-271120]